MSDAMRSSRMGGSSSGAPAFGELAPVSGGARGPALGEIEPALPSSALPPRVSIGQLSLKLTGMDRAQAGRVAQRAMQLCAERLPAGVSGEFAELNLRLPGGRRSEAGLSEAIADAIVLAVQKRSRDRA